MLTAMTLVAASALAVTTNAAAEPMRLSLDEFVRGTMTRHPRSELNRHALRVARARALATRGIYDTRLLAGGGYSTSEPLPGGSRPVVEEDTLGGGLSVEQVVPSVGTRLAAGFDLGHRQTTTTAEEETGALVPTLAFTVHQPLLMNWLGLLDSVPRDTADVRARIEEEQMRELDEAFAAGLHETYFAWLLVSEEVRILGDNLTNTARLLRQVREKQRKGIADDVDLARAEASHIRARRAHVLAEARRDAATMTIAEFYGTPDTVRPVPDHEIVVPEAAGEPATVAISNTRKLRILAATRRILEIERRAARNARLPDLSLSLAATLQGYETNRELTRLDHHNLAVGLSFAWPFLDRAQRGKVQEAEADIAQLDAQMAEFEIEYRATGALLARLLRAYCRALAEDRRLIETTERGLAAERRKYEQGRSDLAFVIDAENSLLERRLGYVKDYVEWRRLDVRYRALTDRLHEGKN